jgi:hypothetical protein
MSVQKVSDLTLYPAVLTSRSFSFKGKSSTQSTPLTVSEKALMTTAKVKIDLICATAAAFRSTHFRLIRFHFNKNFLTIKHQEANTFSLAILQPVTAYADFPHKFLCQTEPTLL